MICTVIQRINRIKTLHVVLIPLTDIGSQSMYSNQLTHMFVKHASVQNALLMV